MSERSWREAKMPKWAQDAADAEIRNYARTAALSWPMEARPEPLPFRWGEYDRLTGEPSAGEYWAVRGRGVEHFHLRERLQNEPGWKSWMFSVDGKSWSASVELGPLFDRERDAILYLLWRRCEEVAEELRALKAAISNT